VPREYVEIMLQFSLKKWEIIILFFSEYIPDIFYPFVENLQLCNKFSFHCITVTIDRRNSKPVCHLRLHKAILAMSSDVWIRVTQDDIYDVRRSESRGLSYSLSKH